MDVDLERLELRVERGTLQTLEFRDEHGTYALAHCMTQPACWTVSFQPAWPSLPTSFERRGIKQIIMLTERVYPQLYAWLVSTFPKEG